MHQRPISKMEKVFKARGSTGYRQNSENRKGWFISEKTKVKDLDPNAEFVHIGKTSITLKLLEEIIEHCLNVKKIQITPSIYDRLLGNSHRELLEKHNIIVSRGREFDAEYYNDLNSESQLYQKAKPLFIHLSDEQKRRFDELLALNFEEAVQTARYLRLEGEQPISIRKLALMHEIEHPYLYYNIVGVIEYLYPGFSTDRTVLGKANVLQRNIKRINELGEIQSLRQRLEIPEDLPKHLWPLFEQVKLKMPEGFLSELKIKDQRKYKIFTGYLALNGAKFEHQSDLAISIGVSKEWVRQLFDSVLKELGLIL